MSERCPTCKRVVRWSRGTCDDPWHDAADQKAPDTADEAKAGTRTAQVAGESRNDHGPAPSSQMGSERLTSQGLSDPSDAPGIAAGLKAAAEGRTKPLEQVRREAADGKAGGTTDEQEHQRAGSLRTAPARQPSDPADALRGWLQKLEQDCPNALNQDGTVGRCNVDYWCGWQGHYHSREVARAAAEYGYLFDVTYPKPYDPTLTVALNRILDGRDDDDDEFWPCGHQKAGEPHDCR